MDVALSRKRSRLALDDDDYDDNHNNRDGDDGDGSDALKPKRWRARSGLEELAVISAQDAWTVDVASILASPTLASPPGSDLPPRNNADKHSNQSVLILCVQGGLQLHYDLLCSALPHLYTIEPSLQAVVLCRDPSTHMFSTTATYSLPLVQAIGPGYNHFVRLGLLHPLGGGDHPLDALVVIDANGKRRLVLPFGWGAGKHASSPAGGIVQMHLMDLLRTCVETLARE